MGGNVGKEKNVAREQSAAQLSRIYGPSEKTLNEDSQEETRRRNMEEKREDSRTDKWASRKRLKR